MSYLITAFRNAFINFTKIFTTNQEETEFDKLYLVQDEPYQIGELAALVPVDPPLEGLVAVQTPQGQVEVQTPQGQVVVQPAGLIVTADPAEGLVVVQPAAVEPLVEQAAVEENLLTAHKMRIKIPVYTNKISDQKFNVMQISNDTKFKLQGSKDKGQITKMYNTHLKDISKIEFCIEIVNTEDPVTYDYILNIPDTGTPDEGIPNIQLGFINLKMYNTQNLTPFLKYENIGGVVFVNVAGHGPGIINIINENEPNLVTHILNALNNLEISINQRLTINNITNNHAFLKTIFLQKDTLYTTSKPVTYETYFRLYMANLTQKISQNVNLVMSYSYDPINNNNYTISFSYVIAPVKTQKKTILTPEMATIISNKLDTPPNYSVRNLVTPSGHGERYQLNAVTFTNPVDQAFIEIYDTGTINDELLNNLKNKPYTLLSQNSIHSYLNILISMLDKPHDIITKRVPEEIQKYMLNSVIGPNIIAYINYLEPIVNGNEAFKQFIEFVKQMVYTFTNNNSKYVSAESTYENAIMLFVCKILQENSGCQVTTTGNNFTSQLNEKFNNLDPNNVVINPDIMYLTSEITDRVNQPTTTPNSTFRKYFSAPEVIDHGHVYNIDEHTNIQFPENYKEIHLQDTDNFDIIFTIHSYSETTNEDDYLYYNVYVWFTDNTDPITPKCVIKYKIPFMNAPDCASVYAGYKNNINYDAVKTRFLNIAETFVLSDTMKELIPYLMLDQFYNAKSLQDDQNQLQVNQISTIIPVPPAPGFNAMPTQFLGLCCDLTSAANGFNYYMSRPAGAIQNDKSIVGYYHSAKKIWITGTNQIKFEINKAPAKSASKDIFNVLFIILKGNSGGGNRRGGMDKNNNDNDNKRQRLREPEPEQQREQQQREQQQQFNQQQQQFNQQQQQQQFNQQYDYYCTVEDWLCDDTKIEEYGQYVYYNTMNDCLVPYFFNKMFNPTLLFSQVGYQVNGIKTPYLSSNCLFDIFSNDFVDKMIKMLHRYYTEKFSPDLNDIIRKCAIYILTKIKLKPDNIYSPNEQIKRSNDLDIKYDELKTDIVKHIRQNNNNVTAEGADNKDLEPAKSPGGVADLRSDDDAGGFADSDDEDLGGGFSKKKKRTNKKKTNKRKTIRKRTNKKKTNKMKTIRKKMKRTIFKTKKNN